MKALKTYIENIAILSLEDWIQIEACSSQKELKKGDILIQKNSRFNNEIFVHKGVLRAYLTDHEGNENTTAFFTENEFVSTNSLRSKDGYSLYTYQALCSTTLILIDSDKFAALLNENEKLIKLVKAVKEKENARLSGRDECLMQVKATDKYLKFIEHYPQIENKIAQHFIASYLGITAVSLSRIRKSLKKDSY